MNFPGPELSLLVYACCLSADLRGAPLCAPQQPAPADPVNGSIAQFVKLTITEWGMGSGGGLAAAVVVLRFLSLIRQPLYTPYSFSGCYMGEPAWEALHEVCDSSGSHLRAIAGSRFQTRRAGR